jgi:uroporphyrinogen-III synthase
MASRACDRSATTAKRSTHTVDDVVPPLEGFTVGITADRRRDEQAELLKRHGVTVVHAPCIRTLALGAEDGMRAATEGIIADPVDFVVANTAIGIRGWLASAAAWGLEGDLIDALGRARILARGPKAAGTLRTAGLDVWWQAPTEQLTDVQAELLRQPLAGRRVAVQHHGDDNESITAAVSDAGGTAIGVPVYRWTEPEDREPALRLVSDVGIGRRRCGTSSRWQSGRMSWTPSAPPSTTASSPPASDRSAPAPRATRGSTPRSCLTVGGWARSSTR